MNEVINAFKQTASSGLAGRRKKRDEEEQAAEQAQRFQVQQDKKLEQVQQQQSDNNILQALQSSQNQNVDVTNRTGSTEAQRMAAAEAQDAAVNQARAEAAAREQAARQAEQVKQANYNAGKNDEGWKKYYNEEFQKEKSYTDLGQAKDFGDWWNRLFGSIMDNGGASRRAEINARNRYTQDLLNQAYDDEGNTLNEQAAQQARNVSNYNMDVANWNAQQSRIIGEAIGANRQAKDFWGVLEDTAKELGIINNKQFANQKELLDSARQARAYNPQSMSDEETDQLDSIGHRLGNLANAMRFAEWSNPMMGVKDENKEEGIEKVAEDTGRFLLDLLPGAASAPFLGVKELSEVVSGKGLDYDTGKDKELNMAEKAGRTVEGLIDTVGLALGGTGTALKSVGKQGVKELSKMGAKEMARKFIKDSLVEGGEEAVQQIGQYFGQGGKLETEEDWKNLASQVAQAGALGTAGGAIFSGIGLGGAKARNAIQTKIDNRNTERVKNEALREQSYDQNAIIDTTNDVNNRINTDYTNNLNTQNITYDNDILPNNKTNVGQFFDSTQNNADLTNTTTDFLNDNQQPPMYRRTGVTEGQQSLFDNMANQEQTSATGQKVNPQNVSNIQEDATGTQASDNQRLDNEVNKYVTNYDSYDDGAKQTLRTLYAKYEQAENAGDMIAKQKAYEDFYKAIVNLSVKRGREIYNSPENQRWLGTLGISNKTSPVRTRSTLSGRYDPNIDSVTITLDQIESIEQMKSVELHEAAHTAWARLTPEQKLTVGNDLLNKLDVGFNINDSQVASHHLDELVACCIEERWGQEENNGNSFAISSYAQEHLEGLAKECGIKPDEAPSFSQKVINIVRTFVDYMKMKIGGLTDVKTFDEFYDSLTTGKFAAANSMNLSEFNPKAKKWQDDALVKNALRKMKRDFNSGKIDMTMQDFNEVNRIVEQYINGMLTAKETLTLVDKKIGQGFESIKEQPSRYKKVIPEAEAEKKRMMGTLMKLGLEPLDIFNLANENSRTLRDVYSLVKGNSKGAYAISQAAKSGDANFVKNLINKYLREGTYDNEIDTYKKTLPNIYDQQLDWTPMTYERTENGVRPIENNLALNQVKNGIQNAMRTATIPKETVAEAQKIISSDQPLEKKIQDLNVLLYMNDTRDMGEEFGISPEDVPVENAPIVQEEEAPAERYSFDDVSKALYDANEGTGNATSEDQLNRVIQELNENATTGRIPTLEEAPIPEFQNREVAQESKIQKPAPAKTGEKYTTTAYQGRGKSPEEIYAFTKYPIAGQGQYYAFNNDNALRYGDNVTQKEVTLDNPLVINNDDQWRELIKKAGWKYANPVGRSDTDNVIQEIDNLKRLVTDSGYDGLVIQYENDANDNKTLSDVFGHDQVIDFKEDTATEQQAPADVLDEVADAMGIPRDTMREAQGQQAPIQEAEIVERPPQEPDVREVITEDNPNFDEEVAQANGVTEEAPQEQQINEPTPNLPEETPAVHPRVEQLRQRNSAIMNDINNKINDLGFNDDWAYKVQEANRNGTEANLTPEEQTAYRNVLKLIDEKHVEQNFERNYLPQQYNESGEYALRAAKEQLSGGNLIDYYSMKRQNAIALGDINTRGAVVDAIFRRQNPDAALEQAIVEDIVEKNPEATDEQIDKAVEKQKEIQHEIDDKADKIDFKQAEKMDIYKKQQEYGEAAGIQQDIDDLKINHFFKSDYLTIYNTDHYKNGFNFDFAYNAGIYKHLPEQELVDLAKERCPYATEEEITMARQAADRFAVQMSAASGDAEYGRQVGNKMFIQKIGVTNIINASKQVKFTDKGTAAFFNRLVSDAVLRSATERSVAQKMGGLVQRAMNSSFRGLRLSTTLNELGEVFKIYSDFGKALGGDGVHVKLVFSPEKIKQIKSKYDIGIMDTGELGNTEVLNALPKEDRKKVIEHLKMAEQAGDLRVAQREMKAATKAVHAALDKAYKGMDFIDKFTQWNAIVQDWKDANYLAASEAYHMKQGLTGAELAFRVRDDFNQRMLPMDRFYKIVKTDGAISKPLFMYLDSTLRMTRQTGQAMVGLNTVGENAAMKPIQRAGRALLTDFVPRALTALVRGVPLFLIFNIPQVGDDYSGIPDEEKNTLDYILNGASQFSPLLAIVVAAYNNGRQDEIERERNKWNPNPPEDIRGGATKRTWDKVRQTFTPLGGWLDQMFGYGTNLNGFVDVMNRGYGINKNGKVTYLAPKIEENPIDVLRGLLYGSSGMSTAREYNNRPDLISSIINQVTGYDADGDGKVDGGLEDFIKYNQALTNPFTGEPLLYSKDDYNRPATQNDTVNYSDRIKAASGDDRKAIYQKSREYNKFLDDLRMNNKDAYDVYTSTLKGDLVPPEKWARIAYGNNASKEHSKESIDLSIWNMMKDRANQWYNFQKSRGENAIIDPAYTMLDDSHAREYLQYKSTATGENVLLQKEMKLDPFWSDFFKKRSAWSKQLDFSGESTTNPRVLRWNDLNEQYYAKTSWDGMNSDDPDQQKAAAQLMVAYPTMYAYESLKRALKAKYGDDYKSAQDYKSWWSENYDRYNAERAEYNKDVLGIINEMRTIEGFPPMTEDQWNAINEFGYSKSSGSKKSSGGYNKSYPSYAPYFKNTFKAEPVYTKSPKAKGFTWKKAPGVKFPNVPMSESKGYDPEILETP